MHSQERGPNRILVVLEAPRTHESKYESKREGAVIQMEVRYLHANRRLSD